MHPVLNHTIIIYSVMNLCQIQLRTHAFLTASGHRLSRIEAENAQMGLSPCLSGHERAGLQAITACGALDFPSLPAFSSLLVHPHGGC
jgi:hypothetical protein